MDYKSILGKVEEKMDTILSIESKVDDILSVESKVDDLSEKMSKSIDAIDKVETKIAKMPYGRIETKENRIEGQDVARLWKCQIMAIRDHKSVKDVAKSIYGNVHNAKQFIEEIDRLEEKQLRAGGNAGSVLIEEQYYGEIIPLLYNKMAVMQLGARKVPMPNGHINIKKLVQGSSFGYVGESRRRNASVPRFSNLRLTGKKGHVKVPFSNDLLRSASPDADRMVRDDMVMQAQVGMDYFSMYGKGTEETPLGISNVTGITKLQSPGTIDGDAAYRLMVQPLKKNNIPMVSPGWVMPPDIFTVLYNETFSNGTYKYRGELKEGRFHGYNFVETNQAETTDTTGDLFFGDFAQFFIGEQLDMEVKISEEATYYDEKGNIQSAFDNDETVVKLLMIHDFAPVYGRAFSFGTFNLS